jgi:DtxR family Mn-dependent transcriptional regulator
VHRRQAAPARGGSVFALGSTFLVKEKESFDDTLRVEINSKEITISNKIATNLYVH